MTDRDYTKIDEPYNDFFERESALNNPPRVNPSDYDQNSGENVIKTGETLENLTINTWIKSRNYKPSKQGFFLDGKRGNFYGNNVFLTGTINALLGRIGSATDYWEIGATGLTGFGNAIIQTNSGATTGIKFDTSSLRGYDAAGAISFQLFSATGNTRVNVLTNKSIFFENVLVPSTNDGQMWCSTNGANKVLWGYFGGDVNKQQVSMSRMQYANSFDYTTNQTITISGLWFQPRSIFFTGFFENTVTQQFGTVNGQAGSVESTTGRCASFQLSYTTTSNVVSDLSFGNTNNLITAQNLTTNAAPKIPSAIDGTGHVTTFYDNANDLLIGTNWGGTSAFGSATWTNNPLTIPSIVMTSHPSKLAVNKSVAPDVDLVAGSWSDTGVVLTLILAANWRLAGTYTILG